MHFYKLLLTQGIFDFANSRADLTIEWKANKAKCFFFSFYLFLFIFFMYKGQPILIFDNKP
jgi:hypothetical protein